MIFKALNIAYLNYISVWISQKKVNEMLLDAFVVIFRLHGPFEASFNEITFDRRPLEVIS